MFFSKGKFRGEEKGGFDEVVAGKLQHRNCDKAENLSTEFVVWNLANCEKLLCSY